MSVVAILPVITTPILVIATSVASLVATETPKVNVCYYTESTWKAIRIDEGELDAYKVQYKAYGYMGALNKDGTPDQSKCNEWCSQNAPKPEERQTPADKPKEDAPEVKETPKAEEPVKPYEAPKPAEHPVEDVPDTVGK